MRRPNRKALVVLICWIGIITGFIFFSSTGRGNSTPLIIARPVDAVRIVLLIPAHPRIVVTPVTVLACKLLPSLGTREEAYRPVSRFVAVFGWVLIFGSVAFTGYQSGKVVFYTILGLLSVLLTMSYALAIPVCT